MLSVSVVSCYPERRSGSKLLRYHTKKMIAPFGRKEPLPFRIFFRFVLPLWSSKYL